MRRAYLHSDVFYSFWSQSSSRQHPAFEMYVRGVLFVCLFIDFASELCNIIAEGFRFMPLGLVRLRTFQLSAVFT